MKPFCLFLFVFIFIQGIVFLSAEDFPEDTIYIYDSSLPYLTNSQAISNEKAMISCQNDSLFDLFRYGVHSARISIETRDHSSSTLKTEKIRKWMLSNNLTDEGKTIVLYEERNPAFHPIILKRKILRFWDFTIRLKEGDLYEVMDIQERIVGITSKFRLVELPSRKPADYEKMKKTIEDTLNSK